MCILAGDLAPFAGHHLGKDVCPPTTLAVVSEESWYLCTWLDGYSTLPVFVASVSNVGSNSLEDVQEIPEGTMRYFVHLLYIMMFCTMVMACSVLLQYRHSSLQHAEPKQRHAVWSRATNMPSFVAGLANRALAFLRPLC